MNPEVHWSDPTISRAEYEELRGHPGMTVWFTGMSGAGKSTLAGLAARSLFDSGAGVVVLDADNVRHGLNADLGFSDEDRQENVRRLGEVALLMAMQAQIVLVTAVSPFRRDRDSARNLHESRGLRFVEIHVATGAGECERRDTKGLYGRFREGTYAGLPGLDSPFEEPVRPELRLDTSGVTESESVETVLKVIGLTGPHLQT